MNKKKKRMADVAMAESMEDELANDAVFWGEVENMDNSSHEEWLLAITGSLMRREAEVVAGLEQQRRNQNYQIHGKGKGRGGGRRQQ